MTQTKFQGNPVAISGDLPQVNSIAPEFLLTGTDLADIKPDTFKGHKLVLNIFPSLDTPVCATSVRKFNEAAGNLTNTKVICISKDLPFAHARFCTTEGLNNVISASDFRNGNFGKNYGVEITDGPLSGLLARAVVILNEDNQVIYTELVDDIVNEPDYMKALDALK